MGCSENCLIPKKESWHSGSRKEAGEWEVHREFDLNCNDKRKAGNGVPEAAWYSQKQWDRSECQKEWKDRQPAEIIR